MYTHLKPRVEASKQQIPISRFQMIIGVFSLSLECNVRIAGNKLEDTSEGKYWTPGLPSHRFALQINAVANGISSDSFLDNLTVLFVIGLK